MLSAMIFNPCFRVKCMAVGPFQDNWHRNECATIYFSLCCELELVSSFTLRFGYEEVVLYYEWFEHQTWVLWFVQISLMILCNQKGRMR